MIKRMAHQILSACPPPPDGWKVVPIEEGDDDYEPKDWGECYPQRKRIHIYLPASKRYSHTLRNKQKITGMKKVITAVYCHELYHAYTELEQGCRDLEEEHQADGFAYGYLKIIKEMI